MGNEPRNHSKANTVLLSIVAVLLTGGLGAGGWVCKEIYTELRSTHDAVLTMKTGTSIEISEIKVRLAAVEVEIAKLKERKP